ncbi:C6 finger domain-containing protein [Colletotrichum higginsianum]|nr:C6 finger domain-containing protein [Colletotrichum higginsianum]
MVDRSCVFPYPAGLSSCGASGLSPGPSSGVTTPKADTASGGSPAGRSPAVIPTPDLAHLVGHLGNGNGNGNNYDNDNDSAGRHRPITTAADGTVNMLHMKLLVHFSLELVVPELDEGMCARNTELTLKTGVDAPFVMHEVLAFSARHMAALAEAREDDGTVAATTTTTAAEYLHHAAQLQTRAIALFNAQRMRIDGSTCDALVLFSSMLGRHLCIDALAFRRGTDLGAYLDCYVGFARVRRGVRTIVAGAWPLLRSSELASLMSWGLGLSRLRSFGAECEGIRALVAASPGLSPGGRETCGEALELLQVGIDDLNTKLSVGRKHLIQIVFSWSLVVAEEYTQMLVDRSPEAIAVLAHYAALLHLCRDLWQVGDAGAYLLGIICRYLGADWDAWLAWPRSVVFPEASGCLMSIDPALDSNA